MSRTASLGVRRTAGEMSVKNEHFVDEALRIVGYADQAGVKLRILGSLAYRIHCPARLEHFARMNRDLTDIDFVGVKSESKVVRELLADVGYVENKRIAMMFEGTRFAFENPQTKIGVDVFADELYFCHRIPLKERMVLDYPTIPLEDLLLEKMQIVEINLKDIEDTLVLLLEHEVGGAGEGREVIDASYIARLLAHDWGFYHTFTTNLEKARGFIGRFEAITPPEGEVISGRMERLLKAVEAEPKTVKWKLRSRVGTRVKWYQEVAGKEETAF